MNRDVSVLDWFVVGAIGLCGLLAIAGIIDLTITGIRLLVRKVRRYPR